MQHPSWPRRSHATDLRFGESRAKTVDSTYVPRISCPSVTSKAWPIEHTLPVVSPTQTLPALPTESGVYPNTHAQRYTTPQVSQTRSNALISLRLPGITHLPSKMSSPKIVGLSKAANSIQVPNVQPIDASIYIYIVSRMSCTLQELVHFGKDSQSDIN